jgi:potassium-transporting ATPase potassium-binding subunit
MTVNGWLQILFFLVLVLLVTKPMGVFMTHVFNRERTFLDPVLDRSSGSFTNLRG